MLAGCALGWSFLGLWYFSRMERSTTAMTDFTSILAGAYLVGTPGLYDLDANLNWQQATIGQQDRARVFPRWPYVGMAMRPLARLPYEQAVRIWQAVILTSFAAFVWLFPVGSWTARLAALSWSIPAMDALSQGQDSPLLLVVLSVAHILWRRDRWFLAGLAISLFAAKYHLLVLIPLLIFLQRRWWFLLGGIVGGGGLIGISALAQGPGWPLAHLANVRRPEIDALPQWMPNLRGVIGEHIGIEVAAGVIVAIWIALLTRRANFELGIALTLIGGILVSHHAYLHDCLLLIPALLVIQQALPESGPLVFILLSPVTVISFYLLPAANEIYVASLLVLLAFVTARLYSPEARPA